MIESGALAAPVGEAARKSSTAERARFAARILLFAGIYFASAKLGLLAALAQPVVSSAWPPAGIALAVLLLFGRRFWPGVALGAFLLNFSAGVPLSGAAAIAVGNTLEAVIGALLLQRVSRIRPNLGRARDVFALVVLGAGVSAAISASVGVSSLWLSGGIEPAARGLLWMVWWAGDAIGILVLTPLLLTWSTAARTALSPSRKMEAAAIAATLVLLTHLLFRGPFNYVYAIFPVVCWAALRFGPRGAATATFLVSVMAISYTVLGLGPFAGAPRTEELYLLQTYIALLAVTGLLLAAATAERKSVEAALENSEDRFREVAARAPIGIYRSTRDGRLVSANAAFVQLLGYELLSDVLALDLGRDVYFGEAEREKWIREIDHHSGTGDFEVRLKRRDGSAIWVRLLCQVVRDEAGQIEYFDGFAHDIGQSKKAEEALRLSEERFALAFHASPVATSITDVATGSFVDVNEQFLQVLGYTREELAGRTSEELGIWVDRGDREFLAQAIREGRPPGQREGLLRTKTGKVLSVIGSLQRIELGGVPCMLASFNDLTEHKRARDELLASEERYRLLFENNPQPMWVFDETTLAFLAVNTAACHHYGYTREEFLSMTIRDIRPREDVPGLARALASEQRAYQKGAAWRHRKKDGSVIEVEITSHPLEFDGHSAQLVLATDVTERRKLEKQLRQSQKMEAVGRLAGGVAHDFNNVLTAILGYAELLSVEVGDRPSALESVAEIRSAGERAASLTHQLLAFSRQQMLEPKVLDVNVLVSNIERMLRRLIGEDIALATVLDSNLGRVRADAGQLEQVVLNLAINARDAMPKGGTLTIETANVQLDEEQAAVQLNAPAGSYVMLALTDTGAGMSADTRANIFEPFFTTKEQGKGTGLGLATVYGIVKQSEGYIWVYSELAVGTVFKVYLPRVEAQVDDTASRHASLGPRGGTETVLLVEDETAVRVLTRKILQKHGYNVLEASGGAQAMELVRATSDPVHLLLTDVVMPGIAGSELASRVAEASPATKVVFMSGYTDDAVVRHGMIDQASNFLQKPFAPDALARKVREVLDEKEA